MSMFLPAALTAGADTPWVPLGPGRAFKPIRFLRDDRGYVALMSVEPGATVGDQRVVCCPKLSADADVLPLVGADRAMRRRLGARRVLGSAGGADKSLVAHGVLRNQSTRLRADRPCSSQ